MGSMNFEEFMKQILGGEEEESGRKVVGVVDDSFVKRFKEVQEVHDRQHEAIKKRISDFADQLKKEHEAECLEHEAVELKIWEDIYDELLLTKEERKEPYSLNHLTGEVSVIPREEALGEVAMEIVKKIARGKGGGL